MRLHSEHFRLLAEAIFGVAFRGATTAEGLSEELEAVEGAATGLEDDAIEKGSAAAGMPASRETAGLFPLSLHDGHMYSLKRRLPLGLSRLFPHTLPLRIAFQGG